MDWAKVVSYAVVGFLGVLFARRLELDRRSAAREGGRAVKRSAAREGRRGSGIGQIVLLIVAVVAAYGAIVSDGADARNFAMVVLITLGALVVSVRADRNRRGA